jgi:hypothetical protein
MRIDPRQKGKMRELLQAATNEWLAQGNAISRSARNRTPFRCPACNRRTTLTSGILTAFGVPTCRRCGSGKLRPG